MPDVPVFRLADNQQAMLDLALACDLKVSDFGLHPAIRARHQTIKSRQEAASYIREVEIKIHSRRKVHHLVEQYSAQPSTTEPAENAE